MEKTTTHFSNRWQKSEIQQDKQERKDKGNNTVFCNAFQDKGELELDSAFLLHALAEIHDLVNLRNRRVSVSVSAHRWLLLASVRLYCELWATACFLAAAIRLPAWSSNARREFLFCHPCSLFLCWLFTVSLFSCLFVPPFVFFFVFLFVFTQFSH